MSTRLSASEKSALSQIFPDKFYLVAWSKGIQYVAHLVLKILDETGALAQLRQGPLSFQEVMSALNFSSKARFSFEWMLTFLANNSFLKRRIDGDATRYLYDRSVKIDPDSLRNEIMRLDKHIHFSCELMEYVANEYPQFLSGKKTGHEVIFSEDKARSWIDYFSNRNSGYRVYNALGAFAISKWCFPFKKMSLLEIGGGTASATELLLEFFRERRVLPLIEQHVFSDISPFFLRLGNKMIMEKTSEDYRYDLKKIDFNASFLDQGIKENQFDLVYGVNALHVAKDLKVSLREILKVLKPGGRLIVSECVRRDSSDVLVQELIFNLLDDYCNIRTSSPYREIHGFLCADSWVHLFRLAGFSNIEILLNTDACSSSSRGNDYPVLACAIKGEKA